MKIHKLFLEYFSVLCLSNGYCVTLYPQCYQLSNIICMRNNKCQSKRVTLTHTWPLRYLSPPAGTIYYVQFKKNSLLETTHLHPVPRSRVSGTVYSFWYGYYGRPPIWQPSKIKPLVGFSKKLGTGTLFEKTLSTYEFHQNFLNDSHALHNM
jgi:hypothetical protein